MTALAWLDIVIVGLAVCVLVLASRLYRLHRELVYLNTVLSEIYIDKRNKERTQDNGNPDTRTGR